MNAHTPWGMADSHEHIAEGIDFYGTPSHGGFKLSAERNAKIPKILRQRSWGQEGMKGWYEEDCDACIVMATFPEYFTAEQARRSGENNPQAKLTNAQAQQIKRRLSRGDSIWTLAKHYGVSHSAIWQIKKGKTWKY